MDLLVFGDAHIKPIETSIDWGKLAVPPDVDLVVSLGDVIHDPREDALEYGREFFERLAGENRPVVALSGNHDPAEYYETLI
jgi:predicted phosphodiesterase